jgi:PAS domain S-box-containing protein
VSDQLNEVAAMKFSPLLIRLFTAHTLLFAAATVATSAASAWRVDQDLGDRYEARGRAIASIIASASDEFLRLNDISAIQAMVDEARELEGDSYVFVIDDHGKIVSHTFAAAVPSELATLKDSGPEIVSRSVRIPGRGDFVDISAPIKAGRGGYVHVGMDPGIIRARVWSAISTQLALLGVIFLVSLVVGVWLVNKIIQPLERLTDYANTMATRDFAAVQSNLRLDEEITPITRRSDEVGQLAKAFRHMVREVAGRERELRQARDELEVRVEERTAAAEQRTLELIRVNAELEREIAERKRTQTALQKSSEEIFDLYNNAPCGYHSVDINGTVLRMNDTELNWLGYTREEVLGEMQITDFVSRASLPVFRETLAEFRRAGKVNEFEFEMLRKDGTTLPVLLNSTAIRDAAGHFVMSRSTIFDITERKRVEHALVQKSHELTRSNQELELFASVASHDLQEPLRMVASYMELLSQRYTGKLDEKADRWIGFAVSGVVRMKQLINDLLEFSRVGTRGKPFAPTDCAAIMHAVTQNLHQAIQDSGATVICGVLPTLQADPSQLAQVFQNLLANAIKFRGSHAPDVYVEAQRQESAWRFSVRDNGIGIDPQFAERIFVIFQRLHTHEEYPGTGIGLALCRKVIERHGGRIWVESQPGKGATFFFTIPDVAPVQANEAS